MLAAHNTTLLAGAWYMPKLPWKKGERDAFKTIRALINAMTIPIFMIPPAGEFDHEIGYIPSPAEHIQLFGKRLFECRGKRAAFIDALYLDDERHRAADPNIHPLTALLERARLTHAVAWPLTSIGRSDGYQEAVAKAHLLHQMPVAMQISLAELESPTLGEKLMSLCNQVSCDPADAVLIIDAGSIFGPDETDFVEMLIPRINELPRLYDWNQIVFSATALSDPQKIKVDEEKIIRRLEWHNRTVGTGNAPTWKWAAVDHHFEMIGRPLAMEVGLVLEVPADNDEDQPKQLSLLSLLESS